MRPKNVKELLSSGFERGGGLRASWRAYRLLDGSSWISVDGKCVDEGETLSDDETTERARRLALAALADALEALVVEP